MEKPRLTLHSNAVNLARRYTEMNENDLVMENLYEDHYTDTKKYTRQECAELARHLIHEKNLPKQCQQYSEVVVDVRRRDSDTTDPTSILS